GRRTSRSLDWGRAPAAPPPPPPPVGGVSVDVTPVSGVVRIRLRGTATFVDLAAVSSVPVGSELDTTRGRVRLVSAAGAKTQTADFYQGRAIVTQARTGALTTLTLSEPLSCPKRKTSSAAAPKRVRRLWGSGKGAFLTKGRYASATVRGTIWLTEDRCTSTLIRVRSGRVDVFDLERRGGQRSPTHHGFDLRLPLGSMGIGIGVTAVANGFGGGGIPIAIVAWIAIALINIAYARR